MKRLFREYCFYVALGTLMLSAFITAFLTFYSNTGIEAYIDIFNNATAENKKGEKKELRDENTEA